MNLSDAEFIKLDGSIIIRMKLDGYIVYKSMVYVPYEFRDSDIVEVRTTTTKVNKANDNLSCMFDSCNSLTSVDASSWNTSNVTDMTSMFGNCRSLTSVDVSSWNTSNVTDMSYMFNYCTDLTSLDLSNFDTSNVTHMWAMFRGCQSLTSLDLRKWDMSKIFNMYYLEDMFKGCNSLRTLRLDNCDENTIYKIIKYGGLPTGTILDSKGNTITRKIHCKKAYAAELKELLPSGWEFV
jgi:surface protein